jgi:hypothetical protein
MCWTAVRASAVVYSVFGLVKSSTELAVSCTGSRQKTTVFLCLFLGIFRWNRIKKNPLPFLLNLTGYCQIKPWNQRIVVCIAGWMPMQGWGWGCRDIWKAKKRIWISIDRRTRTTYGYGWLDLRPEHPDDRRMRHLLRRAASSLGLQRIRSAGGCRVALTDSTNLILSFDGSSGRSSALRAAHPCNWVFEGGLMQRCS